ncbi:MAG: type II toxin-antitoxin system RelB/DinJ family antitoxin [Mycoplasmataceae bacterium]|nr:type II toxin-antitoxin system RelB/DinJ family antitoxin [Mycoplasmataceae bacterium]
MKQLQVNLKLEDNVKDKFVQIVEELGLSPTTAINVFVRWVVRNNGIPFIMENKYDGSANAEKAATFFEGLQKNDAYLQMVKDYGFKSDDEADEYFFKHARGKEWK